MTNYQEGFHPYGGYGKRPTSEGGGGGGAQIKLVNVPLGTETTPVVGGNASDAVTFPFGAATSMIVDGTELLNANEGGGVFVRFISGSNVKQSISGTAVLGAYIVTFDTKNVRAYATVTEWSKGNYSTADELITYTMPSLAKDEYLVFVMAEG